MGFANPAYQDHRQPSKTLRRTVSRSRSDSARHLAGSVSAGQDRIGGQPKNHVEVDETWVGGRTRTRVSSLSLVRYRTNDYSVPVAYGHREVWTRGYVHEVVIGCGGGIIARPPRSYERDDMVFDLE